MHSIIQTGLIPGGRSNRKNRQSVFFTAVNPIDIQPDKREDEYDLDKPRIAVYKNTWIDSSKYSILVQVEARSEKRIAVQSNTIPRNRSFQHFACDMYWESGFSWRLERIYTGKYTNLQGYSEKCKPTNLQHWRQDPSNPRKSAYHQSEQSAKYEEICRGNVDCRIQGVPHSTVQKADSSRREIVKRLIQQFETDQNRDSLTEDLNKIEEFNPFNKKSKELITSMGNTEYFELCEISSKMQCPWLLFALGSWHCIRHLRQMYAAVGRESTVEHGKIRRPVNSRLRY